MLQVFGRAKSRSFRVIWLLEELKISYKLKEINPQSTEALQVYKNGKIPFIIDNGILISDSVAILTYLSDKNSTFTESPGTIKRAKQDSITHRVLDEFDSLLWVAAKHIYVLPIEKRVPKILEILRWEFVKIQEKIVAEFSVNNFICGEKFLITDIILIHCLIWAESMNFPICEDLTNYFNRISERPAFKKSLCTQGYLAKVIYEVSSKL